MSLDLVSLRRTLRLLARTRARLLRSEKELALLASYSTTIFGEQLPLVSTGECEFAESWGIAVGPMRRVAERLSTKAAKIVLLHRCDTPSCVRHEHITYGTYSDNVRDAALKGRLNRRGRAADCSDAAREARRIAAEQERKELQGRIATLEQEIGVR